MEILRERGVEFDAVEYLKTPLSRADFARVLALIENAPADLVRKDKNFKELGLDADAYQSEAEVTELLLEHPKLMQRPVVIRGERAVIARPSATVEELLD